MKRKKLHKRGLQIPYGGLARLSLVITILLVLVSAAAPSSNTALSQLPVPRLVTETMYSGPLTLSSYNVSVLGAQTIDPIDFVNEINKERAKTGAPPLRLSTVLMNAAKMRANVILKYQNFSHLDPHEGIELRTVLPKLNYHFVYASENIGMGGMSAANFVEGFMHSTSHRENLLNPKLTETGAAVVDGPYHQYYVNIAVQLFAIPGGRDEFLGYSPSDRTKYEGAHTALAGRLFPIRRIIQQMLRNPDYTGARIKNYSRQKEILETILARMRNDKPLQNPDVALILEYNTLL